MTHIDNVHSMRILYISSFILLFLLQVDDSEERAFIFMLTKKNSTSPSMTPVPINMSKIYGCNTPCTKDTITITLRMASLCYTHSPSFIRDLSECVSDFTEYASRVGESIKHAATEMALDWVHNKKGDASMIQESNMNLDTTNRPSMLVHDDSFNVSDLQTEHRVTIIKMDAVLQSPVIILPEAPNSMEALIFHLGKIILSNCPGTPVLNTDNAEDDVFVEISSNEIIQMEIRDMALYSTNADYLSSKVSIIF